MNQKAKQYTVSSIHQLQQVLPVVQMKNPDIEFQKKKNSTSIYSQSDQIETVLSPQPEARVNQISDLAHAQASAPGPI
jgi:hypothetical protein